MTPIIPVNSNALFMTLVVEHFQTACRFPLHSITEPYAALTVHGYGGIHNIHRKAYRGITGFLADF